MERLGRAPASDAVSTGISACRHLSTKANWGRFLDLSVPIASLISELSPLPAKLPVSKCYGWPRCQSITFVREYSVSAGMLSAGQQRLWQRSDGVDDYRLAGARVDSGNDLRPC